MESREVSPHADGAGPSGSAGRGDIDGEEGVNISLETDVSMSKIATSWRCLKCWYSTTFQFISFSSGAPTAGQETS